MKIFILDPIHPAGVAYAAWAIVPVSFALPQ